MIELRKPCEHGNYDGHAHWSGAHEDRHPSWCSPSEPSVAEVIQWLIDKGLPAEMFDSDFVGRAGNAILIGLDGKMSWDRKHAKWCAGTLHDISRSLDAALGGEQ